MIDKNQPKKPKIHQKPENAATPFPEKPKIQDELAEYKDKYLRCYAEMENIRKRSQAEILARSKVAIADFAKDLLPVADNLERALALPVPEELKETPFFKNFISGVELTQKTLNTTFEKNQITPIQSLGRVFNPEYEQVIQQVTDNEKPSGTVLQVWQKGYLIGGDRVLREAMVVVSKKDA